MRDYEEEKEGEITGSEVAPCGWKQEVFATLLIIFSF